MAKNIVLLSDGTGNSAASAFKTNVWRLYQAIDILPPINGQLAQIAMYDDGVGTETFKPLALLGEAIGVGLANNVKKLYAFLCRNYQPGDGIYLFGFSRGAFTVRILAGLILRCGIVTAPNEDELQERVKIAYTEYKRDAARRATVTRTFLLAGQLLGGFKRGHAVDHVGFTFQDGMQYFPRISFIGVWDTVDAYGMPVDELKEGIDKYVWPMTLADRQLSVHVDRACQALSLDDERPTFRPVLWTDVADDPSRLTQLWFAGVHANVGGGYPDDGLAYVTQQWMMDEAALRGLRFYKDLRDDCSDRADLQGRQYDSRAGLAGYYRYGPRSVDGLSVDREHGVHVRRPVIHDSAVMRIAGGQVAYAPVSFPCSEYEIMGRSGGAPALTPGAALETNAERHARSADLESARNAVVRKRIAYLLTVALSLVLALLPLFDFLATSSVVNAIDGWFAANAPIVHQVLAFPFNAWSWIGDTINSIPIWSSVIKGISAILRWISNLGFVPGWLSPWLASFVKHPALLLVCGSIVLWLFVRKNPELEQQVFARTQYAFLHNRKGGATGAVAPAPLVRPSAVWMDHVVGWLRHNSASNKIYTWLAKGLLPFLFALFIAVPVGALIFVFFIPKFVRNQLRRRRYQATLSPEKLARIPGPAAEASRDRE